MGTRRARRPHGTDNRHQLEQRLARWQAQGWQRLPDNAADNRGTVAWACCDLNRATERAARAGGRDVHEVKVRPVVVWGGAGDHFHVLPCTTSTCGDVVELDDPGLPDRSRLMPRIVSVPRNQVGFHGDNVVGRLAPASVVALETLLADGEIIDLTDRTGTVAGRRVPVGHRVVRGRRVLPADVAFDELRRQREAIIASHRRPLPEPADR